MMVATRLHSVPMVGAAAKESLLYQLKGDVDLVHIAAHGFYDADTPLFSRLALAEGDGSDGNLEPVTPRSRVRVPAAPPIETDSPADALSLSATASGRGRMRT